MGYLKLLGNDKKTIAYFISLGFIAGLFNMGIIALINEMINVMLDPAEQSISGRLITAFVGCIIFWFISRRILSYQLIDFTQHKLWGYRKQLISSILKSDYLTIYVNRNKIQTIITEDVRDVSNAVVLMIDFIISVVTVICVFIYLAYLSIPFFVATLIVAAIGIGIYMLNEKRNLGYIEKGRVFVDNFHIYLQDIIQGFKELKMDKNKGDGVHQKIVETGNQATTLNVKALKSYLDNLMSGQVSFYLLIGFLMIFFGSYIGVEVGKMVNYLFALLFVISPLELIMTQIPELGKGIVAQGRMEKMIATFGDLEQEQQDSTTTTKTIQRLTIKGLKYTYQTDEAGIPFSCGPLDLELNAGEIVFISGGNGSGKTTLINLVLGLLNPHEGSIEIDHDPNLFENHKKEYRTLFAPVFSDFYLFHELYGIEDVDQQKANYYLELFELEHKVSFQGNKFSTRDLSMGQRKRLALISQILEEKPILVLDEWAADQDPFFRKKFYQEILPHLKQKGFTIIAITHDDSYFAYCDRRYHMNSGKIVLVNELKAI